MELLTRQLSGSHAEDHPLGVVHFGIEFVPVQEEEGLEGRVPTRLFPSTNG